MNKGLTYLLEKKNRRVLGVVVCAQVYEYLYSFIGQQLWRLPVVYCLIIHTHCRVPRKLKYCIYGDILRHTRCTLGACWLHFIEELRAVTAHYIISCNKKLPSACIKRDEELALHDDRYIYHIYASISCLHSWQLYCNQNIPV